jgi:hypothetical protein
MVSLCPISPAWSERVAPRDRPRFCLYYGQGSSLLNNGMRGSPFMMFGLLQGLENLAIPPIHKMSAAKNNARS